MFRERFETVPFLWILVVLALVVPILGIAFTEAPFIWPVSTVIYSLGLYWAFSPWPRRSISGVFSGLLAFGLILLEGGFFFSYYLQNTGFNGAFFYHLRPDLIYAGIGDFIPWILFFVTFILLYVSVAGVCVWRGQRRGRKYCIFGMGLFLLGLIISPSVNSMAGHFFGRLPGQKAGDGRVLAGISKASVDATFRGGSRYNVILLYLESVEQRYFDEQVFPDLLPGLNEIRGDSVAFTQVSQGVNAGWTIAGMVATQCGYPLSGSKSVTGNNLGIYDSFMPEATCLGDLLQDDGYRLTYMGGADERFAGKGEFLRTHGYSEILGKTSLLKKLADKSYINYWGINDDTLFSQAYEKFLSLSDKEEPFLLTLLTLGTHPPNGFFSRSCSPYGANFNPMLDAVHCTDQLASDFIRRVRSSPYSDKTIIVVMSDHLAMRNASSGLLASSDAPRRLSFFVDLPEERSEEKGFAGTSYDIGPTILDIMGYEISGQMGFGSSLLEGPGYLVRQFGEEGWLERSAELNEVAASLWDDGVSLENKDIFLNNNDLSVSIGSREFNLRSEGASPKPASALFLFDSETLVLDKVHVFPFDRDLEKTTLAEMMLKNGDSLALVISRAVNLPGFCDYRRVDPSRWCFFFGKPGSRDYLLTPINGDISVPRERIEGLRDAGPDQEVIEFRERIVGSYKEGVSG